MAVEGRSERREFGVVEFFEDRNGPAFAAASKGLVYRLWS
jgi:hypothetical protein